MVAAWLHSQSPATVTLPDLGPVYQPAWYGDGQKYYTPDMIEAFGPLGIFDRATGNAERLAKLRWAQINRPPGGARGLTERVGRGEYCREAVLYFLLLDPAAPAPTDPRPALAPTYFAPGIGRLLARTDWTPGAAWFTYQLGWRGSMTKTRSPAPMPRSSRVRAAWRDSAASCAAVWSAISSPSPAIDSRARASGSSTAQRSRIELTALKRSGTSTRNRARSRS